MSRNGTGMRVLLGVMTSPLNPRLRSQWREWSELFHTHHTRALDVRFVVGHAFHQAAWSPTPTRARGRRKRALPQEVPLAAPPELLREERAAHDDDFVFVGGREKLPHVGKVTEKSAAWWLTAGVLRPGYDWYCKADDDTLVHLDRLHHALAEVRRSRGSDAPVYFGHIKWRGWDVGHRFQACGGGWGPARKTGDDIYMGGTLPGGVTYPPCPHAAGPYPYMSGGMVCMSRAMVDLLHADAAFNDFFSVAKERNTAGIPCHNPHVCASQPVNVHMWHHEDAGVGFNVFRAVVAANASAHIVPVPGHYNDNGIIERTTSAQDMYWSSRAVFVHGIKGPGQYASVRRKWKLDRRDAYMGLRCFSCASGGTNGHNGDWQWARLPCPDASEPRLSGNNASGTSRHCPVEPTKHFKCCGWPWVVPELVDLILSVLRAAPAHTLPLPRMHGEMKRELKRSAPRRNARGCVRDCLDLQLPGPQHMSGVLNELEQRGLLRMHKLPVTSPRGGETMSVTHVQMVDGASTLDPTAPAAPDTALTGNGANGGGAGGTARGDLAWSASL